MKQQVYGVVLLVVVLLAYQTLALVAHGADLQQLIKEVKVCEWMCLAVYSPVCGSDEKTYSNYCTFGLAQCKNPSLKLKHPGGCETAAIKYRLGDDIKLEAALSERSLNPVMFVKCEELGGECVQRDQGNQCKDGMSTENDGMCFFREMVCCAPDSSEGMTTEGTDGTEASMATDEPGQFVRLEDELLQKNLNPWMPFVKCAELEGECLHHHHAKRHCKGGKSIDKNAKCPKEKMVCCVTVMTDSTERPATDGLMMATNEPDIGPFVRIEDELLQRKWNPWNPEPVECGELEGECLTLHYAKRHCNGDRSTMNDGLCPSKMVCCSTYNNCDWSGEC